MIEALIADRATACSADDLADALDWTLRRALAAIDALRHRLERTGQTLVLKAGHRYALAARTPLLDDQARQHIHQSRLADLDPATGSVLHQIPRGPRENRFWTNFSARDEREAIRHLIAAQLVYDNGSTLRPTDLALVTFGVYDHFNTSWHFPRVQRKPRHAADAM